MPCALSGRGKRPAARDGQRARGRARRQARTQQAAHAGAPRVFHCQNCRAPTRSAHAERATRAPASTPHTPGHARTQRIQRRARPGFKARQVDERVANVALVLEVDGQVEEVVAAAELLVHRLQQHLLRVLVGDVLNHQRGAPVLHCARGRGRRVSCQIHCPASSRRGRRAQGSEPRKAVRRLCGPGCMSPAEHGRHGGAEAVKRPGQEAARAGAGAARSRQRPCAHHASAVHETLEQMLCEPAHMLCEPAHCHFTQGKGPAQRWRGCPRRAARARTVHHAVQIERKHLVLRGAPLGLRGRVGRAPAEPPAGALAAVVAAGLAAAAAHARHPAHARRPAQAVLRAGA